MTEIEMQAVIKRNDQSDIRLYVERFDNGKLRALPSGRLSPGAKALLKADETVSHFAAPRAEPIVIDVVAERGTDKALPAMVRLQNETLEVASERVPAAVDSDCFANPYAFTPALPRRDGEFGDREPVGHHAFVEGYFSGTVDLELTTVTPLVVLDDLDVDWNGDDHGTFKLRKGADGLPQFPATGLKGAIRSAYEAVTNSRFGVFFDHAMRLGYREGVEIAQERIPVRVEGDPDDLTVRVLRGMGGAGAGGDALPAAWFPAYGNYSLDEPAPGQELYAWVELLQHYRQGRTGEDVFWLWRVIDWAPSLDELPDEAPTGPDYSQRRTKGLRRTGEQRSAVIRGWYFKSNQNIRGKHDERVFFSGSLDDPDPVPQRLSVDAARVYQEVVADYRRSHTEAEISGRGVGPDVYVGDGSPGKAAWSRHIYEDALRTVSPGLLCYASMRGNEVQGLFPVTIGRRLAREPAQALLDPSLRPAQSIAEFSPAERVFGWVREGAGDEAAAYGGQIRVHPPVCESQEDDAVANFGSGVPLAILGAPKPQQGRFYVGNSDADPLASGTRVDETYVTGNRLRGRKFYLHHAGAPSRDGGYWAAPEQDRTQSQVDGWFQEYRRPNDGGRMQRDNQNRSVTGWVKPGAKFSVRINFWNLSEAELGALLWVLSPDSGHLRAGFAKPLGFGSLATKVTAADINGATERRDYYMTWQDVARDVSSERAASTIDAFKLAACEAAGIEDVTNFDSIPWIDAYKKISTGNSGVRVHYPRTGSGDELTAQAAPPPNPQGENFRWFVENERDERLSLPSPGGGNRLPYL